MKAVATKIPGNTYTSEEFNELPSQELQNTVLDSGQSLDEVDLQQLGKAMAIYSGGGDFYTDSGAVNAYVVTTIGSKLAPPALFDGMRVRFIPGNTNTGASTINVNALGAVAIEENFVALPVDRLISGSIVELSYSTSAGAFQLISTLFTNDITIERLSPNIILKDTETARGDDESFGGYLIFSSDISGSGAGVIGGLRLKASPGTGGGGSYVELSSGGTFGNDVPVATFDRNSELSTILTDITLEKDSAILLFDDSNTAATAGYVLGGVLFSSKDSSGSGVGIRAGMEAVSDASGGATSLKFYSAGGLVGLKALGLTIDVNFDISSFETNVSVNGTAAIITSGSGSPEGVVTATIGSRFSRTDGGASTSLYVKESGAGNTGWVSK